MNMEKPVTIQGKHNRYWIKKCIDTQSKEPKKLVSLPTMERKLQSYLVQDKKKQRYDESSFVSLDDVVLLLQQSEGLCFYCQKPFMVVYENVKEEQQWTLDRIDNNIGHNRGNLVIACLRCNLKRRKKSMHSFLFSQQLHIERDGFEVNDLCDDLCDDPQKKESADM